MESLIDKNILTCGKCGYKFDRSKENKHCSNCIVCTGCEVYYCQQCDEEIVITPVKPIYSGAGHGARGPGQERKTP